MNRRQITIGVLIGLACGVAGMLPWLVYGARLIVQSLWATSTVNPADMPIVLLPFSQYQLDFVAGVIVIGSAVGGCTARILAARGMRHARSAILTGTLIAQFVALVQTAITVASGLRHRIGTLGLATDSVVYLVIVIAWIVTAIAIGATVFILMTRATGAPLVIGTAIAAVVLEAWIRGFVAPITALTTSPDSAGPFIAHWAPALVVGVAVGWAGIRSWRQALAAIAALVILWLGSATMVAIAAAAGSRALARLPDELMRLFGSVFGAELRDQSLMLALVAAALALIGLGVGWAISRHGAAPAVQA